VRPRLRPSLALLGSALLFAAVAAAEEPALPVDDASRVAARTLGETGIELFRKGDYEGALIRFDRAEALVRMPTLGVRAARCLEKLGRLVEASERYLSTTALTIDPGLPPAYQDAQRKAQEEAAAERAALLPRIPTLVITTGGDVTDSVTLDGRLLPAAALGVKRPVDPGKHVIVARRGSREATREVTLAEGGSAEVEIELPPPDGNGLNTTASSSAAPAGSASVGPRAGETSRPGAALRPLGWASVAVGAVAAGLGLGALGVALSKQGDLDRLCPGGTCETGSLGASGKRDYDTYHTARTLALVGIISGVALAGGGTVLLVVTSGAPRQGSGGTVSLRASLGGLTVSGQF
jgi:hypothetical protein